MRKRIITQLAAVALIVFFAAGCLSPTQSTVTEYRPDGSVEKVTVSSESVISSLTESTKNKTVIAWESGWLAYLSVSTATTEDPTPTAKIFAGKADKGLISALPGQKWDGIAAAIAATRQDLSVTTNGIENKSE